MKETIMEQNDENNEYKKFCIKLAKNAREVMQEYNKLSPANKQRADMEAQSIIVAQGFWEIWEHLKNPL